MRGLGFSVLFLLGCGEIIAPPGEPTRDSPPNPVLIDYPLRPVKAGGVGILAVPRKETRILQVQTGAWQPHEWLTIEHDAIRDLASVTIHDNRLYMSAFHPVDTVAVVSRDGQLIDTLYYDWLQEPVKVLVRDGRIYVLCNDSENIVVFDAETHAFVDDFGALLELGQPAMRYPHDMAWGPDGNLYVTNESSLTGPVQIWSPDGQFIGGFGHDGGTEGWIPTGITFDVNGDVLVANYWQGSVLRFDGSTHEYRGLAVPAKAGSIQHPNRVRVGPKGQIYVTHRDGLTILDADGGLVDEVTNAALGVQGRLAEILFYTYK